MSRSIRARPSLRQAKLARHLGDIDPSLLATAKTLISRALKLGPLDPEVLVSAAVIMKKQPSLAVRVVDQALSADPANWDALWLRYKISQELGEKEQQEQVAVELKRYYPDAPAVLALEQTKPVALPQTAVKSSAPHPAPAKKPGKRNGA